MKTWEQIHAEVEEYRKARITRAEVVSQNRSRLFKRLPKLEVPKLPDPPMIVSIEDDGEYEGVYATDNVEEAVTAYLEEHKDREHCKISGRLVPAV